MGPTLRKTNHIQKASRIGKRVSNSVTTVYAGQLFQIDENGEFVYADGTGRAYPILESRYPGKGRGIQNELRDGLDEITSNGNLASGLVSNFDIGTTMYDKDAIYENGKALHPSTDPTKKGLVTMYDASNPEHKAEFICGFVTAVPKTYEDFLGWGR